MRGRTLSASSEARNAKFRGFSEVRMMSIILEDLHKSRNVSADRNLKLTNEIIRILSWSHNFKFPKILPISE